MEVKEGNCYSFKLTSGQEVVANLQHVDDEYYHLESPLTIGQAQGGGMEFLPVSFTGEPLSDSAMRKTAVALVNPARPDVIEAYEKSIDPDAVEIITPAKTILTS